MNLKDNTTLSHAYGITSVVAGVVGLIAAIKSDAPWAQVALVVSGWLVAAALGGLLVKCFNQARIDAVQIADLRVEVSELKNELDGLERTLEARNTTLDYVASSKLGRTATARSSGRNKQTTGEVSTGQNTAEGTQG